MAFSWEIKAHGEGVSLVRDGDGFRFPLAQLLLGFMLLSECIPMYAPPLLFQMCRAGHAWPLH
jgi:hypothetical protein